jgi:hypothetical protein
LTVDTNTLFVDSTNNNVGIGSISITQPSAGATTLRIVGTETTKGGAIYLDSSNSSVSSYIYPDNTSGLGINTFTAHPIVFRTTDIERMRITSAGIIGIGTSDLPYGKVTIKSNSATSYAGLNVFASSNNNFIALNHTGSIGIIETEYATGGAYTPIALVTGGGERMRITSGGFVGIATSNPDLFQTAARNLVVGSGTGNNGLTIFSGTASAGSLHFADAQTTGAASYAGYINYEHNTDTMNFGTSSTGKMSLNTNGNLTLSRTTFSSINAQGCYDDTTASGANMHINATGSVIRSTSSLRFKTDIETLDNNISESIYKMRPIWYRSLCDKDKKDWSWYGFGAEELAELEPRLVHWGYKREDYVINEETKEQELKEGAELIADGVQYERITVLLVAELQKMRKELDALKSK